MSFAVNTASKLLLVDNRILQVDHSWLTHLTNNTDYLVYDFLNDSREDLENAITSLSKSFDYIGICFYNENTSLNTFQLLNSMESSPIDSACSVNDWQYTIEWFQLIVHKIQCSSIELIPYFEVENQEDWIHIAELLASSLTETISISNSTINSFFDISISTPYSKLILVDDRISDIETGILSSLTHDTAYIIFNYETDTLDTIKEKILAFGVNFSHISIAQHGIFDDTYSLFSDMGEATLKGVEKADPGLSTWEDYRLFLHWLKVNVQTQYFDLLACYIWRNTDWRYVIETLREDMYIRASVDITGSGGNFILESDNVDTIGIYFTREVLRYKYSFLVLSKPTLVSQSSGFRKYTFTYNQPATAGFTVVGLSYELFKNGTSASNSVRNKIFAPYEVMSVSPYKSIPTDISNVNIGSSYGIKKIQIIKTLSYKRMYFLVSSLSVSGYTELYYYNWDSNTNNWNTTTENLLTTLHSYTSCFRFSPDGTRCVLGTAQPSYTGAYVYYLDYSYSSNTITFVTPFSVINSIQFTGCDINDNKTTIFACFNSQSQENIVDNGFYYSNFSGGNYGSLINTTLTRGKKYDIICNASGTTVIIKVSTLADGLFIYDLSGSSWVSRTKINGTIAGPTGICFGGLTRSENMILVTNNVMTNNAIAVYSVKNYDASLSFSTHAYLSNANGETAPGTGVKSIAFDPDPSGNGIYVVLDGSPSIYYTTLDYVTNYTSSPALTNATYTACNLDSGSYTMRLTTTAIDGSGVYSKATSDMSSTSVIVYDAPTAPTFTQVSQGGFNKNIKIYYTRPSSDGSSNITKYQYSLDNGTTFKTITNASGSNIITDGSYTITDASINGGGQYIIQLRAINAVGASGDIAIDSDYTTPAPYTYPDAPEVSYTLNIATGAATITAVCLYNGGSISTSYKYRVSPSYDILYDSSSGINTFTYPSTDRTYRYYTQNASVSSLSYTSIRIQTPPLSPALTLSITTPNQITMTYTDASYTVQGKLPITNYKYSLDNMTYTTIAYSPSGSYTIQNVTPGIRTVYLKTTNGTTDSDAAIQSIEVYSLPNYPPIITNIFHYDGTLTVTYEHNGEEYNPITTYLYSINGDISNNYVDLNTATPSPFVLTNVSEPITIYMKARNSYGDSIVTSCTTSLGEPTDLYVITGNNKALVSFVPPSYVQNTITGYLYSTDYGQTYYPAIVSNDSFMVNNLTSGVTYKVYLMATDVNGYGSVAVSNSFTPINDFSVSSELRDTYGIFTITDSMAKSIEITIGGNTQTYASSLDNTYYFGGLLNSTQYSVTVSSYNDIGQLSSQTFEIKTIPASPVITNCTVSIPQSKVTVTFNESVSNGYPVTSYKYSLDDISYTNIQFNGGVFEAGIDTSKSKKYTLYLRAVNAYNDSEASTFDFNVGNPPLTAAANLANVSCRESNKIYFEITNYESNSTYQYSITVTSGTGTNIVFTTFTVGSFSSISTNIASNIITLANTFINPTVTLTIKNQTTNNTTSFVGLFVYTNLVPSGAAVLSVNDIRQLQITFTPNAPANYKYRLNSTSTMYDICNNLLTASGTSKIYNIINDPSMVGGLRYSPIIYGASGTYTISGSQIQYPVVSAGITSSGNAIVYDIPGKPRSVGATSSGSTILLTYGSALGIFGTIGTGGSPINNYKYRYDPELSYTNLIGTKPSASFPTTENISVNTFKDTSQPLKIYVACDNSFGTSPDASFTFSTTNYPYKKPEPPSSVSYIIDNSRATFTVKTPINNGKPITRYRYQLTPISASGDISGTYIYDQSYTLNIDLSSNNAYPNFKLWTYSASAEYSNTAYTTPLYSIPNKPNQINTSIIDNSSNSYIRFTYTQVTPGTIGISGYVYYLTDDLSRISMGSNSKNDTSYNIYQNLTFGNTYNIKIAALDNCGNYSAYSVPRSIIFKVKPDKPASVNIFTNTNNTITITTNPPVFTGGDPITGYSYEIVNNSQIIFASGNYTTSPNTIPAINLSANRKYTYKFYANNSIGRSLSDYNILGGTKPSLPRFELSYNNIPLNKKQIIVNITSPPEGDLSLNYNYYISNDISGTFTTTLFTIPTQLNSGTIGNIQIYSYNLYNQSDSSSLPFTIYYPPDAPSLQLPTKAINVLYFPFTISDYTGGFPIQKYTYTVRSINSSNVITDITYDSSKGLYYTTPLNEFTINSYTSGANVWNVSSVRYFQIVKTASSTKSYVLTFPKSESVGTPQLYASQYSSGVWGTLENVSSNFPGFPITATSFRFSRDGSYAIVGCMNDPSFCLYKYTLSGGTYTRSTISMGSLSLSHTKIDISTDGNLIASISSSGIGYSEGGNAYQLLDNTNNYTGIAVSHDGTRIACCTETNVYIRLWGSANIETIAIAPSIRITDIRYNFDSTYLFTNKYSYSIFNSSTNTHSTFNNITRVNKLYDTLSLETSQYNLITLDIDASNNIYGTVAGSNTTSYVYKMRTSTFINPINYSSIPDMSYTITSFKTYNGYAYSNEANLSGNYYSPLRNGVPTDLTGIGRGNLKITFKNTSNIISGYSYKLDISGGSNTQYDVSLSSLTESSLDSNGKYTYVYTVPNTPPGSFYKIQNLKTYTIVEGIKTYESDAYSISMNDYIYVYYVPTAPSFNCIGNTNSFDLSLNQLSSSIQNENIIRYEYSINNGIYFNPLITSSGSFITEVGRYNNIIDPSLNYGQSYKIQLRAVTNYTTGYVGIDSNYIKILRASTSPSLLTTDSSYQKFKINFKEPSLSGTSIIQKYRYRINNVSGGYFEGDISANSDTYTDPSNLFQLNTYQYNGGVVWNPLTYEKIQLVGDRVYVLTHNTSEATSIPKLIYYTNSGGIWNGNTPSDSNITLELNTNLFKFTNDSSKLIYTSMASVQITQYGNTNYLWSMYANGFLYIAFNSSTSNIIKYRVDRFGNIVTSQDSITIFNWGGIPFTNDIMYYNNNNQVIIYKKDKSVYTTSPDSPIFTGNNTLPDMSGNVEGIYFSDKLNTIYYLKKTGSIFTVYSYNMTNENTEPFLDIPYNTNSRSYYSQININIRNIQKIFIFTLNNNNFIGYKYYGGRVPETDYTNIYLQDNLNTPISFLWSIGTLYNLLDYEIFEDYIIGIFGYNNSAGNLNTKFYKLYNFNLLTNTFTEEFLFDYIDINTQPSAFYYSYNEPTNMFYITYSGIRWSQIKYIPSNNAINLYNTQTSITNTISPPHIELITFLDIDITSTIIAACYTENSIYKMMYVHHKNPSYPIIIIDQPQITKKYSAVALSQNSQYLSVGYSDVNNNNLVDVYTYINSVFTFTGSFFINTGMPIYSMRYNADSTMLFASTTGINMFFSCYVDTSGYLIGVIPYNTINTNEPYEYSHPYPLTINQTYNSYWVSNVKYTSIDVSGNSIYLFPNCKDVPDLIVPYLFKVGLTPHSTDSSFISLEKTNLARNNGLPYVVNIKAINYDNIESSGASINAYAYDNPSPPTFTITPSYEKFKVNFTRPVDDGSTNIIAYNYTASGDTDTVSGTYTLQGDSLTGTFNTSYCIPGVTYAVSLQTKSSQVDGSNRNLLSEFSSLPITGIAYTLPNPPTGLLMSPTKEVNSFDISFNQIIDDSADAGYTTITGYKYSISDGAYTSPYIDASYHELYDGRLSFQISSINDASLSPITNYTVYLKSVNSAGVSDSSSTINATNYDVPASPLFDPNSPYNGHAIGSFMKITVSFNKVVSDDPVKTYKIGVSGEEWYDEINSDDYSNPIIYELSADDENEIRRLFSTNAYNVTIIATNSRGDSDSAIDTSSITILTNPSLPNLTAFSRLNSIDLSYSEPGDFGGGIPISYMYYITTTYTGSGEIIPDSSYTEIPYVNGGNLIVNKEPLINYFVYMKFKTQDANSNIIYSKIVHPETDLSYITPYTYPPPPDISGIITDSSTAIVILKMPINESGRDIISYGYYNTFGQQTTQNSSTEVVRMQIYGLNGSYRYNYKFFSINSEQVVSNENSDASFSTNPLPPVINIIDGSLNSIYIDISLNTPLYAVDSSFISITNYMYRYYLSGASTLPEFMDIPVQSELTHIDILGISAGYYTFEIKSFNGEKESSIAIVKNVRVYTNPLPPVFESVIGSYNQIDVSFSQDTSPIGTGNSDISGFYYILTENSFPTIFPSRSGIIGSSSRSITFNDIPAGNSYQLALKTINTDNVRSIPITSSTIKVYTVPAAPTFNQSPLAQYMKVTFSFNATSYDGNTDISGYQYAIQREGYSKQPYIYVPTASAGELITIPSSDLSYGYKYTVYVQAVNKAGASTDVSNTTQGVVYNIPTAPLLVNCSGDLEKIIFTYTTPADDGSNNIIKYQYSLNDNSYIDMSINNSLIATDGSYTIYANEQNYIQYGSINSVKLVAINQAGSGKILDMSTNPVPYTYPPPPDASLSNISDNTCTIHLTSTGDGGNPFDSYWYIYTDSAGNKFGNYRNAGNASNVNFTFTDLSASTQYYLNFYTKNQSGVCSDVPTSFTFITRPYKPTPTITTTRINEITFQYNIPPYTVPLTKYKYYVTNDISGEVDASNSEINISGISAGNYTFTMQVYNGTWYSEDFSQNQINVYENPSPPTINYFTANYESIDFRVSPPSPSYMGNSDISGYLYAFSSSPQETPFDTSYTFTETQVNNISGLTPGIPIYLFVRVTNQKGGISEPVRSAGTVTPYTLPTIAGITLTRNTNTPFSPKIDVSFNADNNSGYTPTTSYKYSVNGSSYTPLPNTTIRSFTIDTSQGIIYDISMIAVNAAGQSSPIQEKITQYEFPSPPSFNGTTVGGYNKITFSFNSSQVDPNTQINIVKYQYSIDSGITYIDISNQGGYILSGSYEITTGVTAGQYYTVNLRSFNNIGYSSPISDTSSVLVYTIPDMPSSITTTASFESIVVSYTAPVLDGSNHIYKYQYVLQDSSITSSPVDASYIDTSTSGIFEIIISNPIGLSYNVYLRAVNAAGSGLPIKSTYAVTPYTYPQPPAISNISSSRNSVSYYLTSPVNTGYTQITGYYYKKNESDSSYIFISGGTDGSQSINDLSDSTAYQYYVYSKNAAGYSQSSTILPFITLPSSPIIQGASCIFPNQISILCEYPSNPPIEIRSFRFEVWQTNSNSPTTKISDSSFNKNSQNRYVIENIPQYTPYLLRAFSYNGINESVYSEQKNIDVFTTPSPPTLGTLTSGKESITFSFTPISTSGGRNISGYKYSTDNFVTSTNIATSPVTFSATPGIPVNVSVKSINSEGFDSSSNTFGTSVIPYTNPSPPTITQIIPTYVNNKNTFIIYYTARADGYSPINNYYYSTDSGSTYTAMNVTTDGSYTIQTSFSLGTIYIFQIKSQNSEGLDSIRSNIIVATSLDVPSSPSITSLSGGYEKILFRFSGSVSDGGTPIIKYQYSISGDTLSSLQDISYGGQYQMSGDYIINNVTPGKNYHVYLYANNIVGNSSPGISGSVMAYTKPDAPRINSITTITSGATVTINAPASSQEQGYSPITHYSYREYGTPAWRDVSYTTGIPIITISDLSYSKTYTYQIAAKNIADYSNTTDISFTTNPLPPTITNVTARYESIDFTFTASTTNGNSLLKHSVAIRDISANTMTNYVDMSSSQNSGTYNVNKTMFPSLTPGKSYSILLKCTNEAGKESTATESSTSVVPYTLPNTPSFILTSIITTSTTLTFRIGALSAPENGYGEIQTYYYYHKGIQYSCTPNTDILLSDLSSSTSYQIGRSATNSAGTSPTVIESVVTNPGKPKFTVTPRLLSLDISYSLERLSNEGAADSSGFYYSVSGGTYSVETYIAGSDSTNTGTFNIPSLTAGTPYQIKLVKKLKNGKISPDAIFYDSSIYPYTYASPPTITGITGLSPTSLHISFNSPSSLSAKGYTTVNSYKYDVNYNDISYPQITDITATWFNLTDLSSGTTYSIRMLTNNTAGDGSYSVFSDGYTLPNYPVINSSVANGDRTIRVVYSAPVNGDLPITYEYALDSSASGQFRTMGNSPHNISGLTAYHKYTLYFRSTNREGSSSIYTYPSIVIPYTLPNAPIFTSLTQTGIGQFGQLKITFSHTKSNEDEPDASYYYLSKSTQPDTSGIVTPTNYDISGLTPGIDYEITLYSVNGAGQTASINKRTLTPYTYPSGITVNSIVSGYEKIIVSINPPTREEEGYDINGIIRYEYTLDNGTSYSQLINNEITGLTAGQQYNVRLRSVNRAGNSPLTPTTTIIPYTRPNSPSFTTDPKSPTSITVRYTSHTNDSSNAGYTTISRYEYSINNGVSYYTATSSPFDISGLIPSTDYTIRMRSLNAAGYSLRDTSSNATTISATPTIVSAVPSINSIIVQYKASALNGTLSPITNYRITLTNIDTLNQTIYNISRGAEGAVYIYGNYTYTISYIPAANYRLNLDTLNNSGIYSEKTANSSPISVYTYPSSPSISEFSSTTNIVTVKFAASTDSGNSAPLTYWYSIDTDTLNIETTDKNQMINPAPVYNQSTGLYTYQLTNLTKYTPYYVALYARNAAGVFSLLESGKSKIMFLDGSYQDISINTSPITTIPVFPTNTLIATAYRKSVKLNFNIPINTGFTGYRYTVINTITGDEVRNHTLNSAIQPIVISELAAGTPILVRLTAYNSFGDSITLTSNQVTPYQPPEPIPSITITPTLNIGEYRAEFTHPFDGGSPITGYYYKFNNQTTYIQLSNTATSFVFIPEDNNQLRLTMYATNIAGDSLPFDKLLGERVSPGAPLLELKSEINGITVTIGKPTNDGNTPITGYKFSINNQVFDENGKNIYYSLPTPIHTDSSKVEFSLHNGDILTDINGIQRTISININIPYSISAIATNRIGDSIPREALGYSYGTPSPPVINGITFVENAILIYFNGGNPNGSITRGLKYSLNEQPYAYIENDNFSTISPLVIYTTTNVDFTIKLITVSNNGDSIPVISNAVNIPDPYSSNIRQTISSGDKIESLNTLVLMNDMLEMEHGAIESDNNTNIMKFVNNIQDFTSSISAQGSLQNIPLYNDPNIRLPYPNKATILVRKYYQKRLNKKNT